MAAPASPESLTGWRELFAIDDPDLRNEWSRAYLERLRWPDGVRCPRCESALATPVASRHQFDCRGCRYRFSVTSGTYLHDSAVALWKWLVAVSLLVESEDGFPAHRLSATIGVSYKTAWSLEHRIRAAMGADNEGSATERHAGAGAELSPGEPALLRGLRRRMRLAGTPRREPERVCRRAPSGAPPTLTPPP